MAISRPTELTRLKSFWKTAPCILWRIPPVSDVTVDQTTGSVIVRIVVPNPDGTILPGMYVRAIIEEGVRENAILVPQQAVSRDPKGNPLTLIVDDKNKVQQRELSTDRSMGDKWLVSSGLVKVIA